jgi:hypothetical protein
MGNGALPNGLSYRAPILDSTEASVALCRNHASEVGVKPTYQDSSIDAFDPYRPFALRHRLQHGQRAAIPINLLNHPVGVRAPSPAADPLRHQYDGLTVNLGVNSIRASPPRNSACPR